MSVNWCFTLNNWTKKEYKHLIISEVYNCIIIGKEGKGLDDEEKKRTPHLQGFIQLKTKITTALKKLNKKEHTGKK